MTPTLTEILAGNATAIAGLATEQGGLAFAGARLSVVALLGLLAAQEAERGAAVRIAENAAIEAILAAAAPDYPLGDTVAAVAEATLSALDEANAALRRRLIALHEAVEARGDTVRDAAILALYVAMARARELHMPAL